MAGLEVEVVIVCGLVTGGGLVEVDGEGEDEEPVTFSKGCWG